MVNSLSFANFAAKNSNLVSFKGAGSAQIHKQDLTKTVQLMQTDLPSVPTALVLSQRINSGFSASLDSHKLFDGGWERDNVISNLRKHFPLKPEEQALSKVSQDDITLNAAAEDALRQGNHLRVAAIKIEQANILRQVSGNERNAHLLETTAHEHIIKASDQGKHVDAALLAVKMAKIQRKLGNENDAHKIENTVHMLATRAAHSNNYNGAAGVLRTLASDHKSSGNEALARFLEGTAQNWIFQGAKLFRK